MKKTIVIALLLIASLGSRSQNVKLEWGDKLNIEGFVSSVMGEDKSGVYVLTVKKSKFFIEKHNSSDFTTMYTKPIEIPKINDKEQDFEAIYFLKNKFLLFTSYYDKKADTYTSYAYKIDREGVLDASSKSVVFEADAKRRREMGDFKYVVSKDSSKILIYNDQTISKEKITRLGLKLYDNDLKLINSFDENIPLKEEKTRISVSNFVIDNDGNIFYCLNKYHPKESTFNFYISSINSKTKEKQVFDIELEKEKISNMIFSVNKSGVLHVSGYFCQKSGKGLFRYEGIAGVYFLTYDIAKKKITSQNTQEFGKEIVEGYLKPKQVKKGMLLPAVFEARDIVEKPDGGQVLISEYRTVITTQSRSSSSTTYTYNDILVTSINANGTIAWTKIVPKRQQYVRQSMSLGFGGGGLISVFAAVSFPISNNNGLYMSYLQCTKGNNLYFIFNDLPKNLAQTDMRKFKTVSNPKKAIPVVVTLDEKGNMTKKPLFESLKADIYLRPAIYYKSSPKNVIIYGSKGKDDKFGRLRID